MQKNCQNFRLRRAEFAFEQVNVVAPKGFGKTEMDLIRIQRFTIFDWMSHKNRFSLQNLKFVEWTKCD